MGLYAALGGASLLSSIALVAVVLSSLSPRPTVQRPAARLQIVNIPEGTVLSSLRPLPSASRLTSLEGALNSAVGGVEEFREAPFPQLASIMKANLMQQLGASYPYGYDRHHGWHQEIEPYDPEDDGCACEINHGASQLECSCGSAWGAMTLRDEGCYGCCAGGCCNECSCHSSGPNEMGPTTCTCPLANKWHRNSGCHWWKDNGGPLNPEGTGGIPEVHDEPGLMS